MRTVLVPALPIAAAATLGPAPAHADSLDLGLDLTAFPARPAPAVRPLRLAAFEPAAQPEALPPAPEARPRTIFGLPRNVGPIDRTVRLVAGVALLGAGIWGLSSDQHLSDTTAGVMMGVSALPLATGASGYCPAYHLFGIESP